METFFHYFQGFWTELPLFVSIFCFACLLGALYLFLSFGLAVVLLPKFDKRFGAHLESRIPSLYWREHFGARFVRNEQYIKILVFPKRYARLIPTTAGKDLRAEVSHPVLALCYLAEFFLMLGASLTGVAFLCGVFFYCGHHPGTPFSWYLIAILTAFASLLLLNFILWLTKINELFDEHFLVAMTQNNRSLYARGTTPHPFERVRKYALVAALPRRFQHFFGSGADLRVIRASLSPGLLGLSYLYAFVRFIAVTLLFAALGWIVLKEVFNLPVY